MRVTLPKDYREHFTLAQLDIARNIIRDMKEDDTTPTWYAEIAANHLINKRLESDCLVRIITASAEANRNWKAWNAYSDGSGDMDIWVNAIAETWKGFIKIGAYVSDIWKIGGDVDVTDEFFVRYFTENGNV